MSLLKFIAVSRPRVRQAVPSACPRGSRGAKWSEVLSRFSVSARRHHAITCRGSRIFTGSLVSWPLSRAAQARPGPFPPDGGKAIAMMHNPRASGLSRAMWPPQGSAVLPAGPHLQPSQASLVGKEDINARPHFRWGAALEVVMRSEMVVPPANLQQVDGKLRAIVYGCLREGGLHRADEALDAAILPGTAGIRALRRDAQEPQCQSEPSRGEDRFVVCAQELRRAIPPERADEMLQHGQRRLVTELAQAQTGATRVVEDSQHHVLPALRVRLDGQIHPPNQIAGDRAGHAVFEPASCAQDRILVSADGVGDERFADRHAAASGEAAVEAVGDRAAADVGHQCFEPNDLAAHPVRLRRRMGPAYWPPGARARPAGPRLGIQPVKQEAEQVHSAMQQPAQHGQHEDPSRKSLGTNGFETS